jgi:hypothetical protein
MAKGIKGKENGFIKNRRLRAWSKNTAGCARYLFEKEPWVEWIEKKIHSSSGKMKETSRTAQ